MADPLASAGDGRGTNGRFQAGNRFGQGNPLAKKVQKLRAVLVETISDKDMATAWRKIIAKAKRGDVVAFKEVCDRLFGKAPAALALTGPDGETLGLSVTDLQIGIIEALAGFPDAKIAVAAKLRELAKKAHADDVA